MGPALRPSLYTAFGGCRLTWDRLPLLHSLKLLVSCLSLLLHAVTIC